MPARGNLETHGRIHRFEPGGSVPSHHRHPKAAGHAVSALGARAGRLAYGRRRSQNWRTFACPLTGST